MGGLKTLMALSACNVAIAFGAHAEDSLVDQFATCVGRLSAQMEHQWLMQDTNAEQSERIRQEVLDVLSAVTSSDALATHAMSQRLDSKVAHASLLQRATFNPNRKSARWAAARAQAEIDHCSSLILSSTSAEPGDVNRNDALANISMDRRLPLHDSDQTRAPSPD